MYEAYRVRKQFGWNGWQFAPDPGKPCPCRAELEICSKSDDECTGRPGAGCGCDAACRCVCKIERQVFGGGIWIVEERHPRKEMMLASRQAIPDPSLPPIDEILKHKRYKRLLREPALQTA